MSEKRLERYRLEQANRLWCLLKSWRRKDGGMCERVGSGGRRDTRLRAWRWVRCGDTNVEGYSSGVFVMLPSQPTNIKKIDKERDISFQRLQSSPEMKGKKEIRLEIK